MNKRYMTNPATERRIINGALWLVGACVIAAILWGCSPYAANVSDIGNNTPTAQPSMTAQLLERANKPTPTPRPVCRVIAYTLNMRRGAGMSYAVIQILESGEALTVIRHAGNWLQIQTAQRVTGWVYGRYCE